MSTNPKRPGTDRVSGEEMAGALADVMQDQAQKAQTRQAVEDRRKVAKKTSPFTWVVFLVLLVASAYVWFGSPGWLDSGPAPVPTTLADAGLRVEVFQQAVLVNRFLEERGRLPRDLSEAVERDSEVVFTPLGSQAYRLELSNSLGEVVYLSSQRLDAFLGNSMEIILQGG